MKYNPQSLQDRQALATIMKMMLSMAGFIQSSHFPDARELVFERSVDGVPNAYVVVFTTIVATGLSSDAARPEGKDAIRVGVVFRRDLSSGHRHDTNKHQYLLTESKVHRTGEMIAIAERTKERMRLAYKDARIAYRENSCGICKAPMFKAKSGSGKTYCADVCWTKLKEKTS